MGQVLVVLVADGGAGALGRVTARAVPAGEVAALDHEAGDNAVEGGAVVLAGPGQLHEVGNAFGDQVGEEAEAHRAEVGLDDGDFFAGDGGIGLEHLALLHWGFNAGKVKI